MMLIKISKQNIAEKQYSANILLNEFLGLKYDLRLYENSKRYEIILSNNNRIVFQDAFWKNFQSDLSYLKQKNIPSKIQFAKNQFITEQDIPIIYGSSEIGITTEEQNDYKTINCGIDIFASTFFMLTRWEEYANKKRDMHNRFSAYDSLALKNNFLHRPIVNEYVEMLWSMLTFLGIKQKRRIKKFELIPTHDIDHLKLYKNSKHMVRIVGGDIIKRKNIKSALNRFIEFYLLQRKKIKDPFNTFDWLMARSESVKKISGFYFMSGGITEYDNNYKIKRAADIIKNIKKRKHIVGFHGSYNSYNNSEQFKKEKELLEQIADIQIDEGRQHYLRFEIPTTWQIWEDHNMQIDSTCGYADKEGFRCGTGDKFSVFNILTRKQLKLKERPLVIMDGTLFAYNHYSIEEVEQATIRLIKKAEKYNSAITILAHNSFFREVENFASLYNKIINL